MEDFDENPEPDEHGAVDLSQQGWRHLDDVVWKMGLKLLNLNVSYNKIEEIPEQIGDLILLKDLNLSDNALARLPARLGDLRCLRHLQVQRNQLEAIPDEIGRCYMLEDLVAHDNQLRAFPAAVVGCAALNVCDLRNNLLEAVPCELGALVTMRNLLLDGNENMSAQVPPYCLADSGLCLFLLKKEYEFREEVKTLRASNLELEFKVREREEYNLRICDEHEDATALLDRATKAFPNEYVNCKAWCRQKKDACCCCCNLCSVM